MDCFSWRKYLYLKKNKLNPDLGAQNKCVR